MNEQILLEFERGGRVAAKLLKDKAPNTCEAVLASLPVQNRVLHAMWAGEEIFFDGFPLGGELEYENATNDVEAGDVAVISTLAYTSSFRRDQTSFCIFYGKSRPRKSVDQTVDVNVFAKIEDVDKIVEIGRRVRTGGIEGVSIRRKT